MKILLFASVLFAFYTLQAQGQGNFATCSRTWTKIGCFKDSKERVLDEMLLNDRDKNSKYHEPGYRLNWHKWKESTHSLACRCAQKALQKGYTVFGLQFYGECWSGQNAESSFNRLGAAMDEKCLMTLTKPTECVQSSSQECVGTQFTNYVYKLTENPGPQTPDVDGDYTNWSQWTECSKTCGGGEKTRERSCTNPPRQGNGRPCEGEPEESVKCNENPCDDCLKVMDLVIVMDSSSSVRRKNFEVMKKFAIDLVSKMNVSKDTTHVSVLHYNHEPHADWNLTDYRARNASALKDALKNVDYSGGGTRTDLALETAIGFLVRSVPPRSVPPQSVPPRSVPQVVIVITDGKTSRKSKKYKDVLKPLVGKGVKIIAIGVGKSVDKAELLQIADYKKDNVFQVTEFEKLDSRIDEIAEASCASRKLNTK